MTTKELNEYFRRLLFLKDKKGKEINKSIKAAVTAGVRDFWAAHPWSFKEKHDTVTTTASQETVDLPDDFEGILSVVEKTSSYGVKLIKKTKAEYDRMVPHSTSHSEGTPLYYKVYFDAGDDVWKLALFPTPSAAISLYLSYMITSDGGIVPDKYSAGQLAAVGKYLTMPGSRERWSATLEFNAEVERLKMIDSPDYEMPEMFLTSADMPSTAPSYWWGPWK